MRLPEEEEEEEAELPLWPSRWQAARSAKAAMISDREKRRTSDLIVCR
jgi:hypothetical protein